MGYLSKGYYIICLSSILSSVLFLILVRFFLEAELEQTLFLGMNISILSIEACGIALCAIGHRKHETMEPNLHSNVPLTAFLIMWGGFITYMVLNYLSSSKPYEKLMLMRETVQFAAYIAGAVKGIIGLTSGLIFTAKSFFTISAEEAEI